MNQINKFSMKNVKIDPANILHNIKSKFRESLWEYLFRKSGAIVMTLFVLMAGMSGFLIYKYLYSSGWSEQKKDEYLMKSGGNGGSFDMEKFEQVIKDIKQRNSEIKNSELPTTKNIFGTP